MRFNKTSFLGKYPRFSDSLPVYCSDGKKLGTIGRTDEEFFTVEKGVFFPKDFTLRYDDIDEVRDDRVTIRESSAEMEKWQSPEYSGWSKVERLNVARDEGLTSIPLYEEELEAKKTARRAGEVSVRKIVHTELRHLTVPLIHEEVRIEHIPAGKLGRTGSPGSGDDSFREKTITVSLMDEEVEVAKRPVLREEVRIGKTQRTEQRDVSGEVRKEEVEIDDRRKKAI